MPALPRSLDEVQTGLSDERIIRDHHVNLLTGGNLDGCGNCFSLDDGFMLLGQQGRRGCADDLIIVNDEEPQWTAGGEGLRHVRVVI